MPRSSNTLPPANAVVVRRSIIQCFLSAICLVDLHRSSSTTSIIGAPFRRSAHLARNAERLGSIGIEERAHVGVPALDLFEVERAYSHVLEKSDDLLVPHRDSILDEWQATLTVNRVERLVDPAVAPLPAFAWN